MKKNVKLLLAVALSVGAWCSASAQGYVQDSSGKPVRSGFDNCVRGGALGHDKSGMGCDVVSNNKPAAPVAATVTEPVVQTRSAAPAASEKPTHKNKKAKKKAKKVKKAAAN